jgi:hypothetical protein
MQKPPSNIRPVFAYMLPFLLALGSVVALAARFALPSHPGTFKTMISPTGGSGAVPVSIPVDCVSVASGRDPFSVNAIATYPQFAPPTNSTDQTGVRLFRCLGPGNLSAMLIGHGDAGLIRTGGGNQPPAVGAHQKIWYQNLYEWQKALAPLSNEHVSEIVLFGCSTGAGNDGAQLLNLVARITQAKVRASSYLVYCDKGQLYLDKFAQWVEASPTVPAVPVQEPIIDVQSYNTLKLWYEQGFIEIPKESVLVDFVVFDEETSAKASTRGQPSVSDFLNYVDFANPFQPGGYPDGEVTGHFQLTWKRPGDQNLQRKFTILQDALVVDDDHPFVFYRVASSLQKFRPK